LGVFLADDMKTYAFKVLVEPDEDRWHARCPVLQSYGASTWGATRAEAYKHIQEVVEMIVQELREDGIAIPDGPVEDVEIFSDTRVAVAV
jgi:predicted RNase H-like HicB family nuclease